MRKIYLVSEIWETSFKDKETRRTQLFQTAYSSKKRAIERMESEANLEFERNGVDKDSVIVDLLKPQYREYDEPFLNRVGSIRVEMNLNKNQLKENATYFYKNWELTELNLY